MPMAVSLERPVCLDLRQPEPAWTVDSVEIEKTGVSLTSSSRATGGGGEKDSTMRILWFREEGVAGDE